MPHSPYRQFIEQLSDNEVTLIMRGEFSPGCRGSGYALLPGALPLLEQRSGGESPREWLIAIEDQLLPALFQQQPLCRVEFDYQAGKLLSDHGAERFCHHTGNSANWALMIDEWHLVAVGPEDVRSKYGYFCESPQGLQPSEAKERVAEWLRSGRAYEDYRSKTHCRYCL
ncbi:MAG: hypothetical protein OEZ16_05550 [Chromatiales bacterium]|nr:hypothetical protein [Chromatiales bacterium]